MPARDWGNGNRRHLSLTDRRCHRHIDKFHGKRGLTTRCLRLFSFTASGKSRQASLRRAFKALTPVAFFLKCSFVILTNQAHRKFREQRPIMSWPGYPFQSGIGRHATRTFLLFGKNMGLRMRSCTRLGFFEAIQNKEESRDSMQ